MRLRELKQETRLDLWDFVRANNHLVTLLALVVLATAATRGIFIRPSNLGSVILRASVLGMIAIGQTLVILTAGLDLSVAANLGLCVATMSYALRMGLDPVAAMAIGVASATFVGLINGLICAYTRVPPFIVTLSTMMMVFAASIAAVGTHATVFYEIQDFFNRFMDFIPVLGAQAFPALVWVFFTAFWILFLRYSRFGHNVYATGGKERAAFYSGVAVARVKILVYTLSGLFAGLATILYVYRLGGTNPVAGREFLLESVAATVIGGTALSGGEGKMIGTFVGALVLTILVNAMNILNVNPFIQKVIIGFIFIGFVYLLERVRTLRLMRQARQS